ncbi:MAG: type II toxin-antitoxin system death-on-curing family toxin [Alphaproteobacteria bacterium]|nr:type II toxin-antitoxin system death-on-curing family toxin [Alphaproteobacteria bacterium]
MAEPVWILPEIVIAIHHRQIAEHGGADGIRDAALLESALHKPKQCYAYENPKPDLAKLAASYAYGIALNHPFIDGNKRVAFVTCRLFLKLNGADITASPKQKFQTFIKLAAGELSEAGLTNWISQHIS